MNNLQISLLEGPDSLINFALSVKFDEHLSLPRPGRQIREDLSINGTYRIARSSSPLNTSRRIGCKCQFRDW